ncbi:enoyl-CoA delta isomerase 1, mitochondrial-like [Euwallacea similis]|uniref:enoyl-CoA delta isomerase 1, mitochondrial-like n=1 Tax=Euwallacea similis TaxID=1736056 RepID=UPI0034503AA0
MALANINKFKLFMGLARNYSSAPLVNVQVSNKTGISVLTLERPPVNSLNLELLSELKQSLIDLEKNRSRGVILTSAFKTFSSGLDIKEMYKPDLHRCKQFWTTLQDVWISLYGSSFPTVAVINGAAPAGGCLLSMCCEYRVMVPNSIIGLNETQLGIVAPQWFADTMCNIIGSRKTELALTEGKLFTTDEALNVGLIDEIVQTKEEGLEKANGFVGKFARISPTARSLSKKIVRGETLKKMVQTRDADLELFIRTISQESVQKYLGMYFEALKKKQTS